MLVLSLAAAQIKTGLRRGVINIRFFFFFNDTATTEIYTLSLHDALPICWFHHQPVGNETGVYERNHIVRPVSLNVQSIAKGVKKHGTTRSSRLKRRAHSHWRLWRGFERRSEEHTSELQSQSNLVCRLLLE